MDFKFTDEVFKQLFENGLDLVHRIGNKAYIEVELRIDVSYTGVRISMVDENQKTIMESESIIGPGYNAVLSGVKIITDVTIPKE